MKPISPSDLDSFVHQYRWAGGHLCRLRFAHRRELLHLDLVVKLQLSLKNLGDLPKAVKVHLRFHDVEECRFQKRIGRCLARFREARFAFLQGMFFATFDELSLEPNEKPAIHDFRGSEAYVSAKDLSWELLD